jgi:hypothetical protein
MLYFFPEFLPLFLVLPSLAPILFRVANNFGTSAYQFMEKIFPHPTLPYLSSILPKSEKFIHGFRALLRP